MRKPFLLIFILNVFATLATGQEFENPENVGGQYELKSLLDRSLCYPEEDLENKLKAKIKINFIVEADGTSSNLEFVHSNASEAMLTESKRLFNLFLWNPAHNMGDPEAFGHSITISFNPSYHQKLIKKREYRCPPPLPADADTSGKVYTQVEEPAYAGKDRYALSRYLQNNLIYPKEAFERSISGEVILKLVVEPNGMPSNIHVLKSIGGGCDEEAIRIISKLNWKAARNDGKAVRSWVELPIIFSF